MKHNVPHKSFLLKPNNLEKYIQAQICNPRPSN